MCLMALRVYPCVHDGEYRDGQIGVVDKVVDSEVVDEHEADAALHVRLVHRDLVTTSPCLRGQRFDIIRFVKEGEK